jgi:hypothetical protein
LSFYYLFVLIIIYWLIETLYGDNFSTIILENLPDAIAAMAALAASVWITLTVVEHALKEDQKIQWKRIREGTYFEIVKYANHIVISLQISILSIPHGLNDEERMQIKNINENICNKNENYKKEGSIAAEAIGQLWETIAKDDTMYRLIEACGKMNEETQKKSIKTFKFVYRDIKFSLDIFRLVLIPRILIFSENVKLQEALINFEIESLKYENYVQSLSNPLVPKDAKPGLQILQSQIELLNLAAKVYWFIADDLKNDP